MITKPNKSQWRFDRSQHLEYFNARYSPVWKENNIILLRKVIFAVMIPIPSLDCLYVVLNILGKFEPRCSNKNVLIEKCAFSCVAKPSVNFSLELERTWQNSYSSYIILPKVIKSGGSCVLQVAGLRSWSEFFFVVFLLLYENRIEFRKIVFKTILTDAVVSFWIISLKYFVF